MSGAPDPNLRADVSAATQRAVAFVAASGDALAVARARALVGAQPASAVVELLREAGRGVVRTRAHSESGATLGPRIETLGILDDLRAMDADVAERTCEGLCAIQRDDGCWADAELDAEDARIYATGMIAGYLAKTPFVRRSALSAAADYLAARFSPERVKGDSWKANAAYFHCFALVRHEQADAVLQWCGRELERGFRTGLYDAVCTARVFALCRAQALPGSRLAAAELVARILDEQRDDGGYAVSGESCPDARVAHTLDALVVLKRLA